MNMQALAIIDTLVEGDVIYSFRHKVWLKFKYIDDDGIGDMYVFEELEDGVGIEDFWFYQRQELIEEFETGATVVVTPRHENNIFRKSAVGGYGKWKFA